MARQWTKDDILGLAGAYQQACVLTAAADLDIFSILNNAPMTATALAAKLAADALKELKRNRNKAEKLAEKALALNPAEPTAKKVLAKILGAKAKGYLHSGANKGAVKMASRATTLDPNLPGPWFYLGVASNETGKKTEAKAALSRFIQLCPKCGYNASYAKQILKSIK